MEFNPEIITIIGLCVAVLSYVNTVTKDMKKEIKETATFRVQQTERDNLLEHRIKENEKDIGKLEKDVDDITGYMQANSDWQRRRVG